MVVRATPPPSIKPKPVGKDEKKTGEKTQQPLHRLTKEQLEKHVSGEKPIDAKALLTKVITGDAIVPPAEIPIDDDDADKRGPGPVPGRDRRHGERAVRTKARKEREADTRRLTADGEEDRPKRGHKSRIERMKQKQRPTQPRKGKVPVFVPITVRALSEALGVKSGDLLFKLKDHGQELNINSTLDPVLAETIALDCGCELEIKRPADIEEELLSAFHAADQLEQLVSRAPVVTIMGHVDHGKTTLLDKIRRSNVAATEAGGITQVIRAWRVQHNGKPITFLDTPGHQAFTKMRARGAQVTDIVVIVVAADDGVMPQTEEAISHAKAAGVPLVVAINKIDLPNANVNKTRQLLYGLNVLPDNMGGDTPFVETSATSGKGIDELLEQLSVVAELKELKANPTKPARGTCLEAMLSEGEGVQATLLVQGGTLRRGDVLLCGATFGRVRAMYDDLGRSIDDAGPSVPVRITGLDEVPNADDPFLVVPDLSVARQIADKRKSAQQEASMVKREPAKLETLSAAKIAELKVILKADFRGSVEAIRKELEKLQHEEVRVRILESAIGGITENDVWLALTSPADTIIVGFNVVPDDRARALAEERGVQLREYDIIYQLTDDIKSALEGKLKPREEIIHLGRAVVRQTFKISRVGTIAGCYVTQGTIERSAKVRVIRDGVVIYPPADRTAALDSLKHRKEDRREIREGFECGLKIAGYDDIKVGDVIEAFRIEQVQRTLT
jgi:translation initiation factor IF-2